MHTIANTYRKRWTSKGIRKFLILLILVIMFLISYEQTFAVTNNTIPEFQIENSLMDGNDEKMMGHSVEITIFRGRKLAEPNLLIWQTIKEKNNKGFEVERSRDGIAWETISFVEGHGNTTETQEYEFSDEKPFRGTTYYRLKQIDSNGKYEYSEMVVVERKGSLREEILVQNQ